MRSNVLVLFCLLIALQIFAKAHDHSVTSRCQLLDELLSGRLEKQHPVKTNCLISGGAHKPAGGAHKPAGSLNKFLLSEGKRP
ncbi:hypothetical protein SprV_0802467800 [Sparganum proliferum]